LKTTPKILVTKTFLPPQEAYNKILKRAWESGWMTNRGSLVLELEEKIKKDLGANSIIIMNNGTMPIQIALKIFGKGGEIITTPFSYVATTSSIVWENCKPVFVDIDPEYLTIDEEKIEAAITQNTTTILATHVYGNPCNVDKINTIAQKYNLNVIYDAAHCYGVTYKNQSIFNYGDVSTCSFHATKIFHTGEGGAIFCNKEAFFHQLYYSHNFGHDGPLDFHGLGINGKISELQSAMGLAMMPYMEYIFSERKKVVDYYNEHLDFTTIRSLKIRENTNWNYSYYPIIFESESQLLKVENALKSNSIFARRYFNPSLNTLNYVSYKSMPVSESIASRVMCLPLYVGLTKENLSLIVKTIEKVFK